MASSRSHPLMAWISAFVGRVALFGMGHVVIPLEYPQYVAFIASWKHGAKVGQLLPSSSR